MKWMILFMLEKFQNNEFEKTVANLNMDINIKALMIMLMRDSNSLSFISADAIRNLKENIQREEKNFARSEVQTVPVIKQVHQTKFDEFNSMQKELKEKSSVVDLQTNHNFFMKLAEFMFNNDLTLYEIIHTKIYDKMFNGREYELINSRSFFRLLAEKGLKISEDEKKAVNNLLKTHFLLDVIEVDKIAKILEELDIKEDIPNASKNYDYKHLSAHDIRIMNRVVKYMNDYGIDDIEDFIGRDRISVIEVIGKSK